MLLCNINTHIALLRAGLELTPSIVDANVSQQRLKISFTNPFSNTITGNYRFLLDEKKNKNWVVEPMSSSFVLQSRQRYEREIILKFPRNELGGKKKLNVFFSFDADQGYQLYSYLPFEIRFSGMDMNVFVQRINQNDLRIQMVVTNESDQQANMYAFIDLPDLDHRERPISRLQPSGTVTKTFTVRNAYQWLGKYIRYGLRDPKGTKRINGLIKIN